MGTVFDSIDNMIAQDATNGSLRRMICGRLFSPTAATTSCGGIGVIRADPVFTVPTLGSGVTEARLVYGRMNTCSNLAATCIAYEILLGTLTISGNSFSAGSSMPTRTIEGTSVVTASILPIVIATSVSATTPTLTITYTDQDGNTGNSCSMTMPTSPTDRSGFWMTPHLANGDTGVRAVTNMSISGGSAGTYKVYGLIPLAIGLFATGGMSCYLDPNTLPLPIIPLLASDTIAFYGFGMAAASDFNAAITLLGNN